MRLLIATFMRIASVVEAREPCPDMHLEVKLIPETWKNHFTPRRALSCGLTHWAVADDGNANIIMANTPVNTELIGRVIDVACGRHHTLVLTENGIYSAGDNMFGQLGVGAAWGGAVGEATRAHGTLLHVARRWTAPLVAVAAGHYHSAAVDLGGRLYTWGWGVHGQLGLGSIDDQWSPQLVPKFLGRKVVSVSCGACHTCVLVGGEAWVCGAGACGQLGAAGVRSKTSLPVRVRLQDHVRAIAAGYFHNLALTDKGQLWVWGASPQQVRASSIRRPPEAPSPNAASSPTLPASPGSPVYPPELPQDHHLHPQPVDISNVRGRVVKITAGWHHSCIMNNVGTIYVWGLNFDGQLGSGDRKLIQIPTEVKIRPDSQLDTVKSSNEKTPEVETDELKTKAMIACGGDFTIYIDDDGRIYATGNALLNVNNDKDKGNSRIIMMKTTKRIIKIPAARSVNKFQFQPIDRIDIIFPFDINRLQRKPLEPRVNPLATINDFKKKTWADYMVILLKQWIDEDLNVNLNLRAKLAYHNKKYAECLKLLLDNLICEPQDDCFYIIHTLINKDLNTDNSIPKEDEIKAATTTVMSKRIKEISLGVLNDEGYTAIDPAIYKGLYCSCDELKYFKKGDVPQVVSSSSDDLSTKAANLIDKCISIFPIDTGLWEVCFRISKNFYLGNNLSISDLECILRKYMESNAATMAAAIMYSNDCAQYSEILSPKFYLNMCSQVLDTWG